MTGVRLRKIKGLYFQSITLLFAPLLGWNQGPHELTLSTPKNRLLQV